MWRWCVLCLGISICLAESSEWAKELNRGVRLQQQLKYAEAEQIYRTALASAPNEAERAQALNNLGSLEHQQGHFAKAADLYRQAMEVVDRPDSGAAASQKVTTVTNYGGILRALGRLDEAEAIWRKAMAGAEAMGAEGEPLLANILNSFGVLEIDRKNFSDAELYLKRAVAMRGRTSGPNSLEVANSLGNLGTALQSMGRHADAAQQFQRSLDIRSRIQSPDHPDRLTVVSNLASLYREMGKTPEAEALLVDALAIGEKALPADHPTLAAMRNNLGTIRVEQKRLEEAEPLIRGALETWEKNLGPQHERVLTGTYNLANLLMQERRFRGAEALFRKAIDGAGPAGDRLNWLRLEATVGIANACLLDGRRTEAAKHFRAAMLMAEKQNDARLPEIRTRLDMIQSLTADKR